MNLNEMRNQVRKAEKDLQPEARLRQFESMQGQVRDELQALENEKQGKAKEFDSKAEFFKPTTETTISSKEKEEFPEMVVVGDRKLHSKNVAVMDYLTKTVLSRVAIEVETPEDFLEVVSELAHHENENMRYVLIDSFHELSNMVKDMDSYKVIESEVRQAYKAAVQNVKSKEQLKYEDRLKEAEHEKGKLFTKYLPIEKNIQEFSGELNGKTEWLRREIQGESQKVF
ncbi:hypothetical protein [Halobacillus halophilus]|uniref:hypothetical protein n=1 Tax=Halobacillus halophilus TaxID=1570 RepID=UPI001CD1E031|nr:hypothetical protein [Halobacillus halophilus]MCA1011387.1 hypothetical protein [Halobacillus halophilus]